MHGEGKVGHAGKPAWRWYRRDGPRPTVKGALLWARFLGSALTPLAGEVPEAMPAIRPTPESSQTRCLDASHIDR